MRDACMRACMWLVQDHCQNLLGNTNGSVFYIDHTTVKISRAHTTVKISTPSPDPSLICGHVRMCAVGGQAACCEQQTGGQGGAFCILRHSLVRLKCSESSSFMRLFLVLGTYYCTLRSRAD